MNEWMFMLDLDINVMSLSLFFLIYLQNGLINTKAATTKKYFAQTSMAYLFSMVQQRCLWNIVAVIPGFSWTPLSHKMQQSIKKHFFKKPICKNHAPSNPHNLQLGRLVCQEKMLQTTWRGPQCDIIKTDINIFGTVTVANAPSLVCPLQTIPKTFFLCPKLPLHTLAFNVLWLGGGKGQPIGSMRIKCTCACSP